jgi:hypothetical protein
MFSHTVCILSGARGSFKSVLSLIKLSLVNVEVTGRSKNPVTLSVPSHFCTLELAMSINFHRTEIGHTSRGAYNLYERLFISAYNNSVRQG